MNSPRPAYRRSACASCLAIGGITFALLPAPRAHAQTYAWQGASPGTTTAPTSGTWNVAADWSTGTVPTPSTTTELDFGGSGGTGTAYTSTNNLTPVPFVLNTLALGSTATVTETIAGAQLEFGGTAPAVNQTGTGAFTISAPIDLAAGLTLAGTGAGLTQYTGVISDTGSITKSGTGQVNITNANNSFSGGVTLTNGIISSQNSGSLGSGTVTLGGSTVPKWSIGVTANQTYNNPIVISGGNATLEASTAGDVYNGTVSIGTGLTMSVQNSNAAGLGTISNVISGSGNLQRTSALGVGFILAGNNTYTGTTTVTAGVLAVSGTTSGQGSYTIGNNTANFTAGTLAGNGTIGLAAGKTLSVTGILNGATPVQAVVSPSVPTTTTANVGIGTLSLAWASTNATNGATFGNYSTLAIDVGAAGSSDRLMVGTSTAIGKLTLNGTNTTLALTGGAGTFDGSTYVVADSSGAQTGTFATLTVNGTTQASASSFTANGFQYTVTYGVADGNGGFDIDLVPTAVPEPSTWVGALVLMALGCSHSRGRSTLRGLVTRRGRA